MLRTKLNPDPRPQGWKNGESALDYLVRIGLAKSAKHAAYALLAANDLTELHRQLLADEDLIPFLGDFQQYVPRFAGLAAYNRRKAEGGEDVNGTHAEYDLIDAETVEMGS